MKYKILIVDDDEDDFVIMSAYLKKIEEFRIECYWESDIESAYHKMISNQFDIYFVDYLLGVENGLDLIQKSLNDHCIKPTILLSGKGNKELDRKAIEIGVYDFLIKGEITVDNLERCIRYTSERYKTIQNLRINERRYHQIFDNALSSIVICDDDFRILECNDAIQPFIGYQKEEVTGFSIFHYVDREGKTIEEYIESSFPDISGVVTNEKVRFVHRDGSVKIGHLEFNQYTDVFTSEKYWQGVIYDETLRGRKELERLHNEKLNAVHRLINTLAHEVRNPLTNIQLASESITNTAEGNEVYVDIIKRGVRRINDIITNLMNSSKSLKLYFEKTELNELIDEAVQIARDSSQLKNVRIETKYLNDNCFVMLDVNKFKIALINLISNAIEAADKEESYVLVSLNHKTNRPEICIEDNGIGISEENLNKIFEPYFTTKNTGTGLGLASTLNIIRSHNAKIEVVSKVNEGTTFKIVL